MQTLITAYVPVQGYTTVHVHRTISRVWQVVSSAPLPPATLFD
jgi:hypothetical protein